MILGPLNGKRSGHRQDAGFCASGGHDESGTAVGGGVRRDDAQNVAAKLLSDPAFGEGLRAVKRAVEDDAYNGVERVGRKLFRAGDEISGGVVDNRVDAAKLLLGFFGGGFDRAVVAHIARCDTQQNRRRGEFQRKLP